LGDQGNEPEDFLLERLNEAASGDTAVRQLRRRYDLLRHDYESMLDRLGELEDRLNDAATAPQSAVPLSSVAESIAEAISAPLLRLREEYLAAVAGIQGVVSGLEGLASGFKGQHSAAGAPARPEEESQRRVEKVHVDVQGSGFGELLDFQERLSQVSGVSRVTISAIDNERATLVVELDRPAN
jgi:hypothetical protein